MSPLYAPPYWHPMSTSGPLELAQDVCFYTSPAPSQRTLCGVRWLALRLEDGRELVLPASAIILTTQKPSPQEK